ncbi:MAG: hypothetical protein N4A45_04705 [Flavobacteriales bacterium]|jgi:hypothetical protein|nr:hypothetical protein [Flavobacteriales bacterium]
MFSKNRLLAVLAFSFVSFGWAQKRVEFYFDGYKFSGNKDYKNIVEESKNPLELHKAPNAFSSKWGIETRYFYREKSFILLEYLKHQYRNEYEVIGNYPEFLVQKMNEGAFFDENTISLGFGKDVLPNRYLDISVSAALYYRWWGKQGVAHESLEYFKYKEKFYYYFDKPNTFASGIRTKIKVTKSFYKLLIALNFNVNLEYQRSSGNMYFIRTYYHHGNHASHGIYSGKNNYFESTISSFGIKWFIPSISLGYRL